MRQVLFIQGGGEAAHDEWDQKLVDSLATHLGSGYDIRYPRMPEESDPHYLPWKAAIETEIQNLGDGAILAGHSIGATILIHALAEIPLRRTFAGIFLIAAPFVGPGGWPSDEITSELRAPGNSPVYFYHGSADDTVPSSHVRLYQRALPSLIARLLKGRDHQLNSDLRDVAADMRSVA